MNKAQEARSAYWSALGDKPRAAAASSAQSAEAWQAVVDTLLPPTRSSSRMLLATALELSTDPDGEVIKAYFAGVSELFASLGYTLKVTLYEPQMVRGVRYDFSIERIEEQETEQ